MFLEYTQRSEYSESWLSHSAKKKKNLIAHCALRTMQAIVGRPQPRVEDLKEGAV